MTTRGTAPERTAPADTAAPAGRDSGPAQALAMAEDRWIDRCAPTMVLLRSSGESRSEGE